MGAVLPDVLGAAGELVVGRPRRRHNLAHPGRPRVSRAAGTQMASW